MTNHQTATESISRRIARTCVSALIILATVFAMILPFVGTTASAAEAPAEETTSIEMTPTKYEFKNNDTNGYGFGFSDRVTSYCNGINTMGTLTIEGADILKTSYNNVPAIAVKGGTAPVIKYTQTINTNSHGGHVWSLTSDAAKSVSGINVPAGVKNGAFLVFRSSDGKNWSYTGVCVTNINGIEQCYTISGEDLARGTYFKVLAVGEVTYSYVSGQHKEYPNGWCKFWGCHGYWVNDYSNYYNNLGAEYTFFVGDDSCAASFTTSSSDSFDFNDNGNEFTEAELEYLYKATSLADNAVSFSDIKVDLLDIKSNKVTVSINGSEEEIVNDGTLYTEPGAYRFCIESVFGSKSERTLYIMDMGEDIGFFSFFGNGLVEKNMQMYSDRYAIPTFMTGTKMNISEIPNAPGLFGTLSFSADGNTSTVIESFSHLTGGFCKELTREGIYIADLYSSDPAVESGDIAHYVFAWAISEDTDYTPTVNLSLLTSTSRNILYSTKMYSVAVQTAAGGSFLYCFPASEEYYQLAYSLAEKVEMLSVESYDDYYYYNSAENPNVKVKYEGELGKRLMFEVLATYAKANVNIIYAEPDSQYSVEPVKDVEALRDLTKSSIDKDVKVVTDEEIKVALQAKEVYLNDFTFVQVEEYESDAVIAVDLDTNEAFSIKYGQDLSTVFKTSAHIRVTESNWNNKSVYDAVYYAPHENHGILSLLVDGKSLNVDSTLAGETFNGRIVTISEGADKFDSEAILCIKNVRTAERRVLHLSEAKCLALPQGEWELSIINRFSVGYAFTVIVEEELPETEELVFNTLYKDDGSNASFVNMSPVNVGADASADVDANTSADVDANTNHDTDVSVSIVIVALVLAGIVCFTVAFLLIRRKHRS